MNFKSASYHHLYLCMLMIPPLPSPPMTPQLSKEKFNEDMDEVQKWLQSNKLILNVKKTKYIIMIIESHSRLRHLNEDLNVRPGWQPAIDAGGYL